jgi:lipid-binding SYLF domain-containing protein
VLLVMNPRGVDKLLGDQFTLGGEGEVAAGPVGRAASADTDAKMSAEILSWSRNHGVFAGISLQGATLRQDMKDNEALYGKPLANREIVSGNVKPPAAAEKLLSQLTQYSTKP